MTVRIVVGHVLDGLAGLTEKSVHMVWTSVPYWGLRSYNTQPVTWGGSPRCAHVFGAAVAPPLPGGRQGKRGQRADRGNIKAIEAHRLRGQFCQYCNAWSGEHGLEPSLDLWLAHEVIVWRAIRRVLRDDGIAWVNVGDAYASTPNGNSAASYKGKDDRTFRDKPHSTVGGRFKLKDRLMMPARLAIALQDDGWYLRDEVVWHKLNPMPTSVTDRTTPAHEMVYMLAKKRRYFYDNVATMEPIKEASVQKYQAAAAKGDDADGKLGLTRDDEFPGQRQRDRHGDAILRALASPSHQNKDETLVAHRKWTSKEEGWDETKFARMGANKRSVWSIATEPFHEKHFATAPTAVVVPAILAGTSARGVCPHCGAPWKRIKVKQFVPQPDVSHEKGARLAEDHQDAVGAGFSRWGDSERGSNLVETTGWERGCKCPADPPVPATVLDPFGGAGTTALCADRLGRDAILIELNPDYAEMARSRISSDAPLFTEVESE